MAVGVGRRNIVCWSAFSGRSRGGTSRRSSVSTAGSDCIRGLLPQAPVFVAACRLVRTGLTPVARARCALARVERNPAGTDRRASPRSRAPPHRSLCAAAPSRENGANPVRTKPLLSLLATGRPGVKRTPALERAIADALQRLAAWRGSVWPRRDRACWISDDPPTALRRKDPGPSAPSPTGGLSLCENLLRLGLARMAAGQNPTTSHNRSETPDAHQTPDSQDTVPCPDSAASG